MPHTALMQELMKMQFSQISDAIKSTRERVHQLTISTIVGLPAIIVLAKTLVGSNLNDIASGVVLVMPVLLLSFYMFYNSEKAALDRYGEYMVANIDRWMEVKPCAPPTIAAPAGESVERICPECLSFTGWHTFRNDRYPKPDPKKIKSGPTVYSELFKDEYDVKGLGVVLVMAAYMVLSLYESADIVLSMCGYVDQKSTFASIFWREFVIMMVEGAVLWSLFHLRRPIYAGWLKYFGR